MTKFQDGAARTRWTGPATADKPFSVMWRLWLVAAVCLVGAATVASLPVVLLQLAAFATGCTVLGYAISGEGRRPERRVHREGVAVRVEMRPTLPIATAVFVGSFALLGVDLMFSSNPFMLALGAGALLPLGLLPDLVRVIREGGGVTMDPASLRVSSLSTDYHVDWADVVHVYVFADPTIRPLQRGRVDLRVLLREGAPSLRVRRHRWLIPLEVRPPADHVVIMTRLVDEPWFLRAALVHLAAADPQERNRFLTSEAVDVLTGRRPG